MTIPAFDTYKLAQKALLSVVLLVVGLLLCVTTALAQDTVEQGAEELTAEDIVEEIDISPTASLDLGELEAFLDGILATEMDAREIAGVTVAVTSATETLLLKGYGYADAEKRIPVDPNKHLFRVASVSKLFTATAIMQLVERGQIDLQADIRTYLGDLGFDDSKGAITTADLLTHTAGFEDKIFGFYGETRQLHGLSRDEQFAKLAPAQVREPGNLVSYSNYSYALLGEIIARVSGQSYANHVHSEIFSPLGMNNSGVQLKTLGAESAELTRLRENEAKSHKWENGWYKTQTFPNTLDIHDALGNISATSADIARFMRAHLNLGEHPTGRILEEDTAIEMHNVLFSHSPGVNGNAHGFWVMNVAGYRAFEHGGSIDNYRSIFMIFPELELGVFVSGNTESSGVLRVVPERILERFFPKPNPEARADPNDMSFELSGIEGQYISARRNDTKLGKIASATEALTVSTTDDGDVLITGNFDSIRFVRDANGIYRSARDGETLRFQGGAAPAIFFGDNPYSAYEKLTLQHNPITLIAPITLAVLASVFAILSYIMPFLGYKTATDRPIPNMERVAVAGTSVIVLALLAHTILAFVALSNDVNLIYEPFPTPAFRIVFIGSWVIALCAAILTAITLRAVLNDQRTTLQKVRLVAFSAIIILFTAMLAHWNMLSL